MIEHDLRRSPICLTVPGLGNSGPGHWQTIWEQERHDCERIELGLWNDPVRNVWINRIDQAVGAADAPVILVAHSLGCLAVAWWASLLGEGASGPVTAALLVAPPDVDRAGRLPQLSPFAPTPRGALPFPTIVVASTDDPYCTADRSGEMATGWLADLVLIEEGGHLNAASGLGAWSDGQRLLDGLIDGPARTSATHSPPRPPAAGSEVRPIA